MKASSLLKVFDGNRLVGLIDGCNNVDKQPLDLFEKEILRIFDEHKQLKEALIDMCYQFAGWSKGGYSTKGLSVLEGAFGVLGWPDPQICKEFQCDEPGCDKQATCGFPTDDEGYRRTCFAHSNING